MLAAALATISRSPRRRGIRPTTWRARSRATAHGPRPGGWSEEAHRRTKRRFEQAGLRVRVQRFGTAHGRSRNVIGVRDGERRCVRVLMAHTDSMPQGPGAVDNASGVGLLAGLAPRLEEIDPPCTVWLVATGAEEGEYTGSPDHLGALALRRIVPRRRLRYTLSLDEVGRGAAFRLRSAVSEPRSRVERELLAAAREQDVEPTGCATTGGGTRTIASSDGGHARRQARRPREPVPPYGLRHADRSQPRAFRKVQRVVEAVLGNR